MSSSLENHGAMPVEQDPVFDVPGNRARQDQGLDVAPGSGAGLDAHRVIRTCHVLFDDRTLVQVLGHVVSGGADQLDAAIVRLLVGPRALKARQERMVNVDGSLAQSRTQRARQYLHVTRQHHEIATLTLDQFQQPLFLPSLVGRIDGQVMKRNVVGCCELIEVAMVRNDRRNDDRQRTGAIADTTGRSGSVRTSTP